MTKIKNLIEPKFALGELGVELVFPQLIENQTQVLGMIYLVLRENQNVVEIDHVDTDAHAPGQLDWLGHGCARATAVGVPPDRIVTTWPVDRLLDWASSDGA